MKNNATIQARLKDLLDVMDARATIQVFIKVADGEQRSIAPLKVYNFLSESEFMRKYANYNVVGLILGLTTSILIEEEA